MGTISPKDVKLERDRLHRVRSIKKWLLIFVFVLLFFSVSTCLFLLYQLNTIEEKMDYLIENFTVGTQVLDDQMQQSTYMQNGELFVPQEEESSNVSNTELQNQLEGQEDNQYQEGDQRKVYLTFDDGPSDNTLEILDILEQYQVKATFFVIGKTDEKSISLYQEIVNRGHTLGMHSFSHKYSEIYASIDSFKEDYSKLQNYLYDITGKECIFFRFPGGSSNQVSSTEMTEFIDFLVTQDITYFDWNISSGDATSRSYTPDEVIENVMRDVPKYKTSIVLLHDTSQKDATVEALGTLIENLQAMDAMILPIDEQTTAVHHVLSTK